MNNLSGPNPILPKQGADLDEYVIICLEDPSIGAAFSPGVSIVGKGWVLANVDIEHIKIYIGGQFCTYASYGSPRPDIAERFPTYPQADQSGFSFATRIPIDADASGLVVAVKTVDGRETSKCLTISNPGEASGPAAAFAQDRRVPGRLIAPVRLFVEDARIDALGILRVAGWVLSLAPLAALKLFLGPEQLGEPERHLSRPDVALLHPDYPDAEHCGFRLVQQLGIEATQQPALRVLAICEGGLKRQVIMPVTYRAFKRQSSSRLGEIRFCVDVAAVTARGRIALSGWAVAETGIAAIRVEFDGTPVGNATVGISRPDVGNQYPKIASARKAGFEFSHDLDVALAGEHLLTLGILTGDGETRDIPLPVDVQTVPGDGDAKDAMIDEISFDLDAPALLGDKARDPFQTTLTISGWAIARSGVASVTITVDDRILGTPYYGMRREDVAAAFPETPGALLSGFTLLIPARELGYGEHAVRLVILSKNGETAERAFSVICEKSTEAATSETIRPKIGQVEIDHGLALLDQLGHSNFVVCVALAGAAATDLDAASETLASLKNQAYSRWRAVIAGGPAAILDVMVERLSSATGLALESVDVVAGAPASDQVICSLRAGDILGSDALLEFAIRFALNPVEDFIYSDDRRFSIADEGPAAFFKPDWSPDLLLSYNYIGRAWCARSALLEGIGLPISALGIRGDYDTVLRLTERARGIGHLPRVLFETASNVPDPRSDTDTLTEAMQRRGEPAAIGLGRAPGINRVSRRVAIPGRVSVIIPTIAARGLIETTITGLRDRTAWPDIEVICIDNIPAEENTVWKDWLRGHADQVIELPAPFNWSRFNNVGAAAATGDYFLFLNDDIEIIHPDWLEVMVSHAQRPEVGVVGPQLLYPDGKVQHAGMFLTGAIGRHAFRFAGRDEPGPFGLALCERNVIAVTGACMLVRRDAFHDAGGFNETHSVINNDVDYCLRARRAGQRVIFTPHATLIHHELVSRAKLADTYDQAQFQADWGPLLLKGDPYYNRNLSQTSELWATEAEPVETVFAGHPLIARQRVRRILACKLDHIGDFITALPALRRLKHRFPDAQLSVLCAKASKSMAALEPCIDQVLEFNFFHARSGEGERDVTEAELLDLRARLAAHHFDLAIDFRVQPDTRRVLQYTGAAWLAGFENDGLFPWLDIAVPWEGDIMLRAKRTHITDRLTQLVEVVSIACETERPALPITVAQARAHLAALPSLAFLPTDIFAAPLVCVHPGVGNEMRQWPAAHFAALIELLVAEQGARVILIGAGEEAVVAEQVLANLARPDGVFSLVGKTALTDLPYVLRACTLYVGNNSGPKHIAAALGVPTIGVHSAVVEAPEWGPIGLSAVALRRKMFCGPCYLAFASQCTRNLACLSGLKPAEVYQICVRLLATAAAAPPARRKRRRLRGRSISEELR